MKNCCVGGKNANFVFLCTRCALSHRDKREKKIRERALQLGASEFGRSARKGKKFRVRYKGKVLHFGASGMEDFTQHGDPERRKNFRRRAEGIKNGKAYKDKFSPLYWSYYLLW